VLTESEIPESFRQGMKEAERGELVDMDDALKELDRP
jgi:predicted transcriptional regulator